MYRITGKSADAERFWAEALSLDRVAKYLRRLAEGTFPTHDELAAAPTFERFMFIGAPHTICMGAMTNEGENFETLTYSDELICDASAKGWILSRSRLYKVGVMITNPYDLPEAR